MLPVRHVAEIRADLSRLISANGAQQHSDASRVDANQKLEAAGRHMLSSTFNPDRVARSMRSD